MKIFNKDKLSGLEAQSAERPAGPPVMVVDDEEGNRVVMSTILKPHFEVHQAADGEEALAVLDKLPDPSALACIVSDQRMPRMTGVQLFERLRHKLPHTSRIIVTGYTDVSAIVDAINKAEIYRFIVKPFDASDFLITVQRAVEVVMLKRELDAYHAGLEDKVRERTQELQTKNEALEQEMALRREAEQTVAEERAMSLAAANLTPREIDCISWCAAGKTAWETGQILGLSEWTVVYHLERVKRKFGLSSKQKLVARAVSLGLVAPDSKRACAA